MNKGKTFPKIDFSKIILPPVELKIVRRNDVFKIYDIVRKNYYCLTDEEFIRQIFIHWMIDSLGYPLSIIANEIGIRLNDTLKRCDTVVFDSNGDPLIIVEYKAPDVEITQEVFNQIVRYNMVLKAKYLVVTNGCVVYCCKVDYENHLTKNLSQMPTYEEILNDAGNNKL